MKNVTDFVTILLLSPTLTKFPMFGTLPRKNMTKDVTLDNGTDGQTDRQTDGQTECDAICGPLLGRMAA